MSGAGKRVQTPLSPLQQPKLTGWKNGFRFKRNGNVPANKKEGPSRYSKRIHRLKRGTFSKKLSVDEAPTLISVVNAKPEIKQKATEQVAERAKKKEERRKMNARMIIKKPSPKQAKPTWTNVLSSDPNSLLSPTIRKAKAPRGYKPPPGSFKPDWTKAYQQIDLLSPTSGKPKMVAKQDLVLRDRIMSPKKKKHSGPGAFAFPSLDLDGDESDSNDLDGKKATEGTKKTSALKPSLAINEDELSASMADNDQEETNLGGPRAVTPTQDNDYASQDLNSFEDVDSQYASDNSQESTPIESPKPRMQKQLILEFALPSEGGNDIEDEGLQVPVELTALDELSSVGSWPSIESQDSYDTKMNKMMQRWMDVDGDYDEDDRTMYDNAVDLEDNVLDHIALAVPDLDAAMDQFEELTGIRPTTVGPLQGLGATTAHIGLDGNRYLELLAPDLETPGPLGEELSKLEKGTITPYHYSIRSSEVSRLIEGYVYDVLGWDPDHIAMVQALPDTSIRQWDMLTMYGHNVGGVAPCYVKWKDPSHHPTKTIALKATLTSCVVQAPKGHNVHKLVTDVGGLDVRQGNPLLEVTFEAPKGTFTFSSNNPKGLAFPGYDDGQHQMSRLPDLAPLSGNGSVDEDYLDIGSDSQSSETASTSRQSKCN